MKKITFLTLTLYISITIVWIGCKKEELPEIEQWTPQNFWASDTMSFNKFLTWDYYGPDFIDGFKIDRKFGDSDWQIDIGILNSSARSWIDTDVQPHPVKYYEYRIYAFKGSEKSLEQIIATRSLIKPPTIKSIEILSSTACKISWEDNCNFEDAYVIDKKTGDNNWVERYAETAPNSTTFTDTNIYRTNDIMYRLYAQVGSYYSIKDSIPISPQIEMPENPSQSRQKVDELKLTWEYNGSSNIDGFRVKRRYVGNDWELLAELTETTYTDKSIEIDKEIEYGVAVHIGNAESTPLIFYFNSEIPAPENTTYIINSLNSVSFSWQMELEGLDEYILEKRTGALGTWVQVSTATGSAQSITDNNANLQGCLNDKLYYRVLASYSGHFSSTDVLDLKNGAILDERDGEIYETVIIGSQCWLQKNLAWLPIVSEVNSSSSTEPTYHVVDYYGVAIEEAKNTEKYRDFGVLYNYPAAVTACPDGWQLSNFDDWEELINYCGGMGSAAKKLKEIGYEYWHTDEYTNVNGTNEYQFGARAGGYKDDDDFAGSYILGCWWASINEQQNDGTTYRILYDSNGFEIINYQLSTGTSVRCIKNQ